MKFLIFLFNAVVATFIRFDVHFICSLKTTKDFNTEIRFFDTDVISGDDLIGGTFDIIGSTEILDNHLTATGYLDSDELFSSGYYIKALIRHDCTDDRSLAKLVWHISPPCEFHIFCRYTIKRNITNEAGVHYMTAEFYYE
ncbi:unnamed protein product [Caenorhabditis bovis]|uniref:Uncharacterized protein n=1 Tax=Caenorhabditis bovis TaxID=2654633 RepID=A0A8S1EY68_9PELO|nr:unnamed protein product [Caenorhabditis bovis]